MESPCNMKVLFIVTLRHISVVSHLPVIFLANNGIDKSQEKKASAGPQWYNLPKTDLTPEVKRDLQLIQMRGVLDPHRHYKKESGKSKAPEFSQIGTIIEGPTEYYSARIQNKDRKRTFVDEVLAAEAQSGRFKKKASDIQMAKASGKKRHYQAMKEKRASKFKNG
ncbi:Fcf2-domain-containing protein [Pseudovirgaria hyperparasitica]|uniref:Fcf2-domain-containing protein n=1 Tax=Pseudovirgaria hyperparasitica TaxID=470096 RepID=A0A6A6W2A8_9PEZI|nr:Fcf2-domain-containing protein [Pseudovirgaria hyperparasitica]KAF2756154.1 Fcf2-domain-containing protein [Pseudovirgaria hyperparasitica]